MNIKDEELIYNIRLGNREARESLFFNCEKKLGAYTNKYRFQLAKYGIRSEDVKGLIWESIVKSISKYEFHSGIYYSYATLILKNMIIDITRRKNVDIDTLYTDTCEKNGDSIFDTLSDAQIDYEKDAFFGDVLHAIDELGEECTRVVNLLYNGYSHEEIAKMLNMSKKHVEYVVAKIKKSLKNRFDE